MRCARPNRRRLRCAATARVGWRTARRRSPNRPYRAKREVNARVAWARSLRSRRPDGKPRRGLVDGKRTFRARSAWNLFPTIISGEHCGSSPVRRERHGRCHFPPAGRVRRGGSRRCCDPAARPGVGAVADQTDDAPARLYAACTGRRGATPCQRSRWPRTFSVYRGLVAVAAETGRQPRCCCASPTTSKRGRRAGSSPSRSSIRHSSPALRSR